MENLREDLLADITDDKHSEKSDKSSSELEDDVQIVESNEDTEPEQSHKDESLQTSLVSITLVDQDVETLYLTDFLFMSKSFSIYLMQDFPKQNFSFKSFTKIFIHFLEIL